ncbi:DUF4129 domain-containing protein [Nonomuraea sp. NPDC050663]|uniref:DUF4129 domain-containing protein n=1 Tax=Nonomuraea sp. NPDC050663 TaxID=3364370 RepID=UPI0037A6E8B9
MKWWPAAIIVGALLAVGLSAGTAGDFRGEFDSSIGDFGWIGSPRFPKTMQEAAESENVFVYRERDVNSNLWYSLVGGTFVALLVATILAILYAIIKNLIRQRDPPMPSAGRGPPVEEVELHQEAVRSAVRAALQELDDGDDPRKAVIACWLRLEHEAAEAGVPRLVGDTPQELVARLLADHDEEALRQLMGAYHLARYAPHEVSEELRSTARHALARVEAHAT